MIIDTSVILAIIFKDNHFEWAIEQITIYSSELKMSTVNLTEVLIILKDRQPKLFKSLEQQLLNSGIKFLSPDIQQAQIAANARLRLPLNLGDCFAYALAVQENDTILTLDTDFKNIDHSVLIPHKSYTKPNKS